MSIGEKKFYSAQVKARESNDFTEIHRLLSVDEAAQYLGVIAAALMEQVTAGVGPKFKLFGNDVFFREKDVTHYQGMSGQEEI